MEIECRYCKSKEVVRYGTRKNSNGKNQIFKCKNCRKFFSENTTFFKMKNKGEIICTALDLYFKNVSLRKISDHLQQIHSKKVSHVTILKWIRKYSKIFKEYIDKLKVNGSGTIHVDEMMVNINGKWVWFWNAMDKDTKFILSSHLSKTRESSDAKKVFFEVKRKLKELPEQIITDGLHAYNKAYSKYFRTLRSDRRPQHIRLVRFWDKINNNIIERLLGTIRERTKVIRGFHAFYSAKQILDLWRVYYNFIRPHETLNGLTSAEASGIGLQLNGGNRWLELIKLANSCNGFSEKVSKNERKTVE